MARVKALSPSIASTASCQTPFPFPAQMRHNARLAINSPMLIRQIRSSQRQVVSAFTARWLRCREAALRCNGVPVTEPELCMMCLTLTRDLIHDEGTLCKGRRKRWKCCRT